jgi:hypothetical protein
MARLVRIRPRNQITIPNEILQKASLHVGDYMTIEQLESGTFELKPIRVVRTGSDAAGKLEQQALNNVDRGEYETFDTVEQFTKAARERRAARRNRKVAAASSD